MFWHESKVTVRYAETDKMGIVHHSNYPIWFEIGRTETTRETGLAYSKIEDLGIMFPLINLKCSYKSPARYPDEVIVRTCIKSVTNSRIVFGYEALKAADRKVLCTGETEHVWTDLNIRPINIKKVHPEIYEHYSKYAESIVE